MSEAGLIDDEARRRIRDEHGTSLIVEAAAGTGKTTALISRVVAMIERGVCSLDRIALVTFTEKAAGELTLRLRSALERQLQVATGDDDVRERLRIALGELEAARVGTIHGLCADLLRERPIQAGVDPAFAVLSEDEADALIARATQEVLQSALERSTEGLRRLAGWPDYAGRSLQERVRGAARTLIHHRDYGSPWHREPFDREAEIDAIWSELGALAAMHARASKPSDPLAKTLEPFVELASIVEARERAAGRDYDELEARLVELAKEEPRTARGSGALFGPELAREEVVRARDRLTATLADFARRASADLAACLRAELTPIVARYEELKARAGTLDYLDLLLGVRRMLIDDAVRAELQRRFTHLFVDEFQDTDPIQADIVLLMSADDPRCREPTEAKPIAGKLFLVGDPKQSIYRFRRADIAVYERVKRHLLASGAALVELTTNFRSLPAIAAVVDDAFAPRMQGQSAGAAEESEGPALQARYVPLTPRRAHRPDIPAVVALGVPAPYSNYYRYQDPIKKAIAQSTPDAVAAWVTWLIRESGWTIRDPDTGTEVAIAPHHVCLLFRRKSDWQGNDVVHPYVRGLEARGVPHAWISGGSFDRRDEVIALRMLATAIEFPDDALAVYASLRGPLLAHTDAELLSYRDRVGTLHPLHEVDASGFDATLGSVADSLALLRSLHLTRNRRPVAETLSHLFEVTRAHASLALARRGDQELAGALAMLELARRFDRRALSFRGFVEMLEARADRVDASELPASGESAYGVRVTTVHKAKGLEFPVVVLCDPTASPGGRADRWVDETRRAFYAPICDCVPIELEVHRERVEEADRAEIVRLAYVAATRARDLLVVPAVGDGNCEGWFEMVSAALYPPADRWRASEPAPACPAFGEESVAVRPAHARATPGSSVRPGSHRALAAGFGVVWWDPSVLALEVEEREGLEAEELLRVVPGVDDGRRGFARWQDARELAIDGGSLPSTRSERIEARARSPREHDREPSIERIAVDLATRPSGRRLETLFRSVLEIWSPPDGSVEIAAAIHASARALGADEEEARAVERMLEALARHPWMRNASASSRAVPVASRDRRGVVVEGEIDLVHRDEAGCRAVRFSLCEGAPSEAARHEAVLLAEALAGATATKVEPVLWLI